MIEHESHTPRVTYHSEIERLLETQGKTYADIARYIQLKTFGAKRPGEMLRECASCESKYIGYDYGFSRALIARILTPDDDKTYKKLLRLSRRGRHVQREKTASITDSPIRDERELFAISVEAAAELLGMTEEYLLRLEQGKRKNDTKRGGCIITLIRQEGERRIQRILEKMDDQPTSIRQMIPWVALRKKVHGYGDSLQQLSDRLPGIGRKLLQYIINRKDMPPLPVIKRILDAGDIPVTPELTQDWAYQFALHECERSPTDIGRALQSICAETYESRAAFEKMHGSSLKKSLERLQHGDVCELKSIHKALRQLKVAEESPRWLWIESLFKECAIQPALQHWYEQMGIRALSIDWSYLQLPGLTREESPKVLLDTIMEEMDRRYPCLPTEYRYTIESIALTHVLKGKLVTDVIAMIDVQWGSILTAAHQKQMQQLRQKDALQGLLQQAKKIDEKTFSCAPNRIADALSSALEHGVEDTHQLIRTILLTERLIQWAFSYNISIASPYYDTLRRAIQELVQQETSYEQLQQELQIKIDAIASRDQDMALDDDAPGIHRAKTKTGRKMKRENNY